MGHDRTVAAAVRSTGRSMEGVVFDCIAREAPCIPEGRQAKLRVHLPRTGRRSITWLREATQVARHEGVGSIDAEPRALRAVTDGQVVSCPQWHGYTSPTAKAP